MALCSKKKNKQWVWLAYDQDGKQVCGFEIGKRNIKTASKLTRQLELFDIDYVCTDHYLAYNRVIPKEVHVQTKADTWSIEGLNSRIGHYLARFRRKTFCYSKSINMVKVTLTIFFTPN